MTEAAKKTYENKSGTTQHLGDGRTCLPRETIELTADEKKLFGTDVFGTPSKEAKE